MFDECAYSMYAFDWPIKRYRMLDNGKIVSEEISVQETLKQDTHRNK